MRKGWTWTGSLLAGAGLMYLLDPVGGRRRRALIRDQSLRAAGATGDAVRTTSRDLRNRARGVAAEAITRLRGEKVSDEVLAERVRSRIGRAVSHPAAIEVIAHDGAVTLSGPVLRREEDALLSCASSVRGVQAVENHLEAHEQAGGIPALQGGAGRPARHFELFQKNWSPAWRLLVGSGGAGLLAYGVRRRGGVGAAAALLGGGMLARSISNMEMKRLLGIGSGRRGLDVRKTFDVNAPVEDVFAFWSNVENFPRIMSHVQEVRDDGEGRSHWKVAGPGGIPFEWDAVVTEMIPHAVLAWESVPGEAIRHSGIVRFEELPGFATRIDLRLTYKPPAGVIGHGLAALFGVDPKSALEDDMVRFQSLIEEGRTTAHGESVSREEVEPAAPNAVVAADVEPAAKPSPAPRKSRRSVRPRPKEPETTY